MGKQNNRTWSFARVSDRQVYGALIVVGALIRLPFLPTFEVVAYDGTYYLNQARTLFSVHMAGSFPIGYPAAVRLFQLVLRDYQLAGMAVSFLAGVGSAIVAWRIAVHFVRRELAFVAAVAVALNPLFIRLSLMTLSEALYTFFVLLGLLMFIEKRWLWFGVVMGLAAITRPEAIAIVGILGLTRLRHPRQLVAIAAGFLVMYAVNSARLSVSIGRVVILPKSEFIGSSTHYWKFREAAVEFEGQERIEEQIASEQEQQNAWLDYGRRLPGELLSVIRHVFPVVFVLALYALRRRKYLFMAAALLSFFVIPLATVRSIDRYVLPYLPVLILLAVFALGDIRNRAVRVTATALLVASIVMLPVYNRATLLAPEEDDLLPLKKAGLQFRGDVKPGTKIADRKPHFAFYAGGDYVEIPVAPYEDVMRYLTVDEDVTYLVFHRHTIHTLRPALRSLMYSKAVINGELRFRQIFFDPEGVMVFQRVLEEDPLQWTRITPPGGSDVAPAWSPDGTRIAFRSQTSDGAGGIYVIDVRGSRPQKVADAAAIEDPLSWSPDGTRIAYADGAAGDTDIFAVDVASGGVEPLVTGSGGDSSPSWSPSGAEIVFSSTRTGQSEVWAVDLATSKVNQITTDGGNAYPSVSPSGDKVAWIRRDRGVTVYHGSTGELKRLLAPRRVVFAPAWSADERYLAVTASDWGSSDVYLLRTDGSSALLLTKNWNNDGMPSWSPDGQRIAVVSESGNRKFSIWVLDGLEAYQQRLETKLRVNVFTPPAAR
jgi:TolB protein